MLKRALVLTTESARHPFRQRLPAHVLRVTPPASIERRGIGTDKSAKVTINDDQDWKLFVLSFSAFFTAFYSFIV